MFPVTLAGLLEKASGGKMTDFIPPKLLLFTACEHLWEPCSDITFGQNSFKKKKKKGKMMSSLETTAI